MLTLRLNSDLKEKLNNLAELLGVSKSEVVRRSLEVYFEDFEKASPWSSGKEFFGRYSSGQTNLSTDRKTILKEKLKAKKNAKDIS